MDCRGSYEVALVIYHHYFMVDADNGTTHYFRRFTHFVYLLKPANEINPPAGDP